MRILLVTIRGFKCSMPVGHCNCSTWNEMLKFMVFARYRCSFLINGPGTVNISRLISSQPGLV